MTNENLHLVVQDLRYRVAALELRAGPDTIDACESELAASRSRIAELEAALAESRADAARVAWLIRREVTHFFPCLHSIGSKWHLNTDEDWYIECGPDNKPPVFPEEARERIDAAMDAEREAGR